jgi:hypothetical protein
MTMAERLAIVIAARKALEKSNGPSTEECEKIRASLDSLTTIPNLGPEAAEVVQTVSARLWTLSHDQGPARGSPRDQLRDWLIEDLAMLQRLMEAGSAPGNAATHAPVRSAHRG